jgi:hypothetical protein
LDLVTAEGNGFVLEADKRLASLDRLAIETGSLSFVESIATGNRIIPNVKKGWKDMQMWAIFELGSGRLSTRFTSSLLKSPAVVVPVQPMEVEISHGYEGGGDSYFLRQRRQNRS